MNRPRTYTAAAILQCIASLVEVVIALAMLPQGATALDSVEGPGYAFTLITLLFGLAGLFSAFGIWKGQKWGVILAIVVRALSGLSALPGLIFAGSSMAWKIGAWWGVLVAIAIIVLLLWPRPATTARRA